MTSRKSQTNRSSDSTRPTKRPANSSDEIFESFVDQIDFDGERIDEIVTIGGY